MPECIRFRYSSRGHRFETEVLDEDERLEELGQSPAHVSLC